MPMSLAQQLRHLRRANTIARAAIDAGHHPFGALLVAPDGDTVLLEQATSMPSTTPSRCWRARRRAGIRRRCCGTARW